MWLQLSTMEDDQLTSTAEAARRRRELRRRKILENSDNRMKQVMGQNDTMSETPEAVTPDSPGEPAGNMWRDSRQDGVTYRNIQQQGMGQGLRVPDVRSPGVESHMLRPGVDQHYTQDYYSSTPVVQRRPYGDNTHDLISPDLARPPLHAYSEHTGMYNNASYSQTRGINSWLAGTQQAQPATPHQLAATAQLATFNKTRSLICLALGFLVRIALYFHFGRKFVQSMVYPFFAAEVVFLGYQQAAGMDIASGMQSGLWLTVLILCGIKKELIESYKLIMTIVTTIGDDFTIYFFAFAVLHATCKYLV